MKYRITEIFLFFCIFGDRDGDSIVGIKQKKKGGGKFGGSMMDPKDPLWNLIDVQYTFKKKYIWLEL